LTGLRAEELERAQLIPELAALDDVGEQATAFELVGWCDFDELRLSVIPVVNDTLRRLRFSTAPAKVKPKPTLGSVVVTPRFQAMPDAS
jgi:hypothetical protein